MTGSNRGKRRDRHGNTTSRRQTTNAKLRPLNTDEICLRYGLTTTGCIGHRKCYRVVALRCISMGRVVYADPLFDRRL